MFDHVLKALIRINFVNGPWEEDAHFGKIVGTAEDMFRHGSVDTHELFKASLADMQRDPCLREIIAEAEEPDQAIWEYLPRSNPFQKRAGKAVMGRFLEVIRRLKVQLEDYGIRKFFYQNACLECNLYSNADFVKCVVRPTLQKGTQARREGKQEMSLQKACINQMAAGSSSMLDPLGKRKDLVIVTCAHQWDLWYSEATSTPCDCSSALRWVRIQLRRNIIDTLQRSWMTMSSPKILRDMEFVIVHSPAELDRLDSAEYDDAEDSIAFLTLQLHASLTYHWLMRLSFLLLGPSTRSAAMINDDEWARKEVQYVKRIHEEHKVFINS